MVEETQTQEVWENIAKSSTLTTKKGKNYKTKKYSKNGKTKPGNCNYCKKTGHWNNNCRIFKKE